MSSLQELIPRLIWPSAYLLLPYNKTLIECFLSPSGNRTRTSHELFSGQPYDLTKCSWISWCPGLDFQVAPWKFEEYDYDLFSLDCNRAKSPVLFPTQTISLHIHIQHVECDTSFHFYKDNGNILLQPVVIPLVSNGTTPTEATKTFASLMLSVCRVSIFNTSCVLYYDCCNTSHLGKRYNR